MSRHSLRASGTLTLPIQQANRTDRGNGESHQCSPSSRPPCYWYLAQGCATYIYGNERITTKIGTTLGRNHCSRNSETENLANLIRCLHIFPSLSALSIRIHYILTPATIGTALWNVTQKAASPLCPCPVVRGRFCWFINPVPLKPSRDSVLNSVNAHSRRTSNLPSSCPLGQRCNIALS